MPRDRVEWLLTAVWALSPSLTLQWRPFALAAAALLHLLHFESLASGLRREGEPWGWWRRGFTAAHRRRRLTRFLFWASFAAIFATAVWRLDIDDGYELNRTKTTNLSMDYKQKQQSWVRIIEQKQQSWVRTIEHKQQSWVRTMEKKNKVEYEL